MIQNTLPDFLDLNHSKENITISDLEHYYSMYPEVFTEYFNYHCPKTEERLTAAIEKYPGKIENIRAISKTLPEIITNVLAIYNQRFETNTKLNFHLLVGGFGSNAFVERKIIGDVFFAAEKLSQEESHLQIIAAHEIGHVYHNILSEQIEMDWSKVDWTNGLVTLYREGVATYLSMVTVPGAHESVYFSYDAEGSDWLTFSQENLAQIKQRFLLDAEAGWTFEKEREWFRLSGGSHFGYNRLGYFLGTAYVKDLVSKIGLDETLIYWNKKDVKQDVIDWLKIK
ncbi:DUF5700 domain-containing putative Zn-dependent protease [Bacillus salacetis]|uniref:DUF5700 domain-containing putative Zn-dependent protease n=1 Tax=Bacillus salacetis TaxID=2315464 RepID=UPI003BA0D99B